MTHSIPDTTTLPQIPANTAATKNNPADMFLLLTSLSYLLAVNEMGGDKNILEGKRE